jgi:large subunit ribosomal protein L22
MKAFLKNYRQSPQKVRLVAKSISGKKVEEAALILSFMPKRAALPLQKLILSAASNAKQEGKSMESLAIDTLSVDKGVTLKRIRPRARGSAFRINKRTSNVTVTLKEIGGNTEEKSEKKAPAKKAAAKKAAPAKKEVAKKVAKKKVAKKADK